MAEEPREIVAHKRRVNDAAFSPDGTFVVTAGDDRLIKLWSVEGWELFSTFFGHRDRADCVSFGPEGEWLASGSADGTVRVWTFPFGAEERVRDGHRTARIGPRGDVVASRTDDGRLRLWSLESGETLHLLDLEAQVTALAFRPGGEELLTATDEGEVVRWRVHQGDAAGRFRVEDGPVTGMRFVDGGGRLAVVLGNGALLLLEADDGSPALRIDLEAKDSAPVLAVSPAAGEVAVATPHRVRTYALDGAEPRLDAEVEPDAVAALAFSPDGAWLVAAGSDRRLRIWER